MIKYNHLVANLLVFHTTVGMTKALDAIAADGRYRDAMNDAALAGLSPYQTEHINRFGSYVLDLSQPPAPPSRYRSGPDRLRPPRLCEVLDRILAMVQAQSQAG